jgi:hypothetical protein
MPKRIASSEELSLARPNRVAAQRKQRHERYLHYLSIAARTRSDNGFPAERLEELIQQGKDELSNLTDAAKGRIAPRRRPQNKASGETCTIYIDECGSHNLAAKEKFQAFVLSAVAIRDCRLAQVDAEWKSWKRYYLGSSTKKVHEPDIRAGEKSFWCGGNKAKRKKAIAALDKIIPRLDFTGFACVVNMGRYKELVGAKPLDESLPAHLYLMAVNFLAERLALALDTQFNGAKGRLVLEARGPKEDATIQYEFARLFLDGTSYVSAAFFRQMFFPGLEFRCKESNTTGLQLADLLARPCGEKVLKPRGVPNRWQAFRNKLCVGMETGHSILGLKVVPWEERYEDIWTS